MNLLFAQSLVEPGKPETAFTWMAILGAFIAVMMVGAWVVESSKRRHQRREWEHAERMRMIETGMPVFPEESSWAKAFLCSVIGGLVPLIAFVSTYIAHERPGSADELWIVPALVSGASVLFASVLAGHLFRPKSQSNPNARDVGPASKPVDDPDAIDVVGSRG